ncbi:MAG: cystathionine beta-lyase [Rickettsiales bacterium]|jgi:cystathionine beta-lyase|nr:cystathionine beta-lyase [Rickettsiales bacterium]
MHKETLLATLGCQPEHHRGVVNMPPHRASTILFPTMAELEAAEGKDIPDVTYGRYGTPTTAALEDTIAQLEGVEHAIATASGLSAIAVSLMAFLKSGDHVLMADSVYGPSRRFCNNELKRFGVETTYYDPTIGAGIKALIKPNTKVIYCESPGSLTFEVQDIPAISKVAREHDIIVMLDNTWATLFYNRPFELGADIVIHSATKYFSGHSDLVMGSIACRPKHYKNLVMTFRNVGPCPSGDNCYLALRGLRTMGVRVKQQYDNAMIVAKWLKARPEVEEVLFPALPGAPGHEIWKRDFTGASSLFAIAMKGGDKKAVAEMVDHLELFGLGYSWGGYESLVMPNNLKGRVATQWKYSGPGIRLHIGLEHPDDIIKDLEAGLKRYASASKAAA